MAVIFLVSARVFCELKLTSLRQQCLPWESTAEEAGYPGILAVRSASRMETVPDFRG